MMGIFKRKKRVQSVPVSTTRGYKNLSKSSSLINKKATTKRVRFVSPAGRAEAMASRKFLMSK